MPTRIVKAGRDVHGQGRRSCDRTERGRAAATLLGVCSGTVGGARVCRFRLHRMASVAAGPLVRARTWSNSTTAVPFSTAARGPERGLRATDQKPPRPGVRSIRGRRLRGGPRLDRSGALRARVEPRCRGGVRPTAGAIPEIVAIQSALRHGVGYPGRRGSRLRRRRTDAGRRFSRRWVFRRQADGRRGSRALPPPAGRAPPSAADQRRDDSTTTPR